MKITELKQIYINLQALNFLFKMEFFNVNEENFFSKIVQNFNIFKFQIKKIFQKSSKILIFLNFKIKKIFQKSPKILIFFNF